MLNRLHKSIPQFLLIVMLVLILAACIPTQPAPDNATPEDQPLATPIPGTPAPTAVPTRPPYEPGEVVDYTAQTGDTLPALAVRFNTTVEEIRAANPVIPQDATTMPPGFPMKIPIYFQALWGSPFQIIPDALFPYGPAQQNFDPVGYVNAMPGWFRKYKVSIEEGDVEGGEMIVHLAQNFSISPRLLLALVEYQTSGLTQPVTTQALRTSPLGFNRPSHAGLYRELTLAANILNDAYYRFRAGKLTSFERQDGTMERPDPWQNAATVALQYYFAQVLNAKQYQQAISGEGFIQTYTRLYGDPWSDPLVTIPGSLVQPAMAFPFSIGAAWNYTGGPHTAWGDATEPWAAVDFAPPTEGGGCSPTVEWATAVADGVIVRNGNALTLLDLDGDGDERTGWVVFYLHLKTASLPPVGSVLKTGDPIGHPSCDGGTATGTHVHIARKYNGEWVQAYGPLAFNFGGWVVEQGEGPYDGTMVRYGKTIRACVCSDIKSQVIAGSP